MLSLLTNGVKVCAGESNMVKVLEITCQIVLKYVGITPLFKNII